MKHTVLWTPILLVALRSTLMDDGFDPVRADRDLWSFLNLNVTGTSVEGKFRTVKRLRGLEAWRAIVVPIEPKTLTKRRELHRKVHHPTQCKKLSEVEQAIRDWKTSGKVGPRPARSYLTGRVSFQMGQHENEENDWGQHKPKNAAGLTFCFKHNAHSGCQLGDACQYAHDEEQNRGGTHHTQQIQCLLN